MATKNGFRKLALAAIALLTSLIVGSSSHAGMVTTTFDDGLADGWTSFPSSSPGPAVILTPQSSGGIGNTGYLAVTDNDGTTGYVRSPASFTAQPAMYGGALSFAITTFHSDDGNVFPLAYPVQVGLRGMVGSTSYDLMAALGSSPSYTLPPVTSTQFSPGISLGSTWQTFTFNLNENNWFVVPTTYADFQKAFHPFVDVPNVHLSTADFQSLLSNLTGVFIMTDYTDGNLTVSTPHTGIDDTYLDNISLTTQDSNQPPVVPEPTSVVLLGIGAMGLIGLRRRSASPNLG